MFGIDDDIANSANLINTVVERVWPDATEVEKAKLEQLSKNIENEYNLKLEQIKVNAIEAQSPNWFTSNWRPFIGWIGGFSLAYSAILEPIMRFVARVQFDYTGEFPAINDDITLQIVLGMLGLGAMRSFDKVNNTVKK